MKSSTVAALMRRLSVGTVDFAELIGVTPDAVVKWIAGRNNVSGSAQKSMERLALSRGLKRSGATWRKVNRGKKSNS